MVRLRQHDLSTLERGRVVPSTGLTVDQKLSDSTVVTANVSPLTFAGLALPMVCAVEWSTGTTWGAAPGGRHIVTDADSNDTDQGRVYQLQFQNYLPWMLDRARVLGGTGGGERSVSGTPGAILITLIGEAQARGWGAHIGVDFTATATSDGKEWAQSTGGLSFTVGTSVWAVLQSMLEAGVCEFTVTSVGDKDVLHLFNPGTGVDRTGNGDADLVALSNPTDAPVKWSLGNVYTRLGATMNGGGTVLQDVAGAFDALGPLEGWLSQGGVSDAETAQALLAQSAKDAVAPDQQTNLTRQANTAKHLPWRDYSTGDLVKYRTRGGWLDGRVTEFALTVDQNGTISIQDSFGPAMLNTEAKLAKIVSSQLGGVKLGGNGSPATLPPLLAVAPNAPDNFTADATGYWDTDGTPKGRIDMSWSAVTQGVDGSAVNVATYEVWLLDVGQQATTWLRQSAAVDPTASVTGLPVGGQYQVSVVAVTTAGGRSVQSNSVQVTVPAPSETLAAPSDPVLASRNSAVTVTWDGVIAAAAAPAYLWHVVVEQASSADGPWTPVGSPLPDAGSVVLTADVGSTVFARLVPYDKTGRAGTVSAVVSVEVSGVGLPDIDDALAQATFTGNTVQTDAADNTGVKMFTQGIVAYDATGNPTVFISQDGTIYFAQAVIDGDALVDGTVTGQKIDAATVITSLIQAGIAGVLDLSANDSINLLIGDATDPLASQIADASDGLATQQAYFRFEQDADGNPVLTLGSQLSPFQFQITNGQAAIIRDGTVISHWDASGMYADHFAVGDDITIGNHKFMKDGANRTVIKAV